MKYIKDVRTIELSARNVTALLAKLSDPLSARTLAAPGGDVFVQAVEDNDVRGSASGLDAESVVMLTRDELWALTSAGTTVLVGGYMVLSVPDSVHYTDRKPGEVYMPDSGMRW